LDEIKDIDKIVCREIEEWRLNCREGEDGAIYIEF
jgi:hypothetical protein